jgi:tRNA threonylcarbamoyl adenosine modification protein YeaZ
VSGNIALAIEISNPTSGPRGRIDPANAGFVAGPGVALGVFDDPQSPTVLGAEPLSESTRHDDDLMPAIDRLCRRCGVRPAQLSHVAVSVGPGGYTSLRIAVATAKMLAEGTGASTIAVPSAAVAAWSAVMTPPALVCIASKGTSAWAELLPPAQSDPWWSSEGAKLGSLLSPDVLQELRRDVAAGQQWLGARVPLGIIEADVIELLRPRLVIGDRFLPQTIRGAAADVGADVREPVFAAEFVLSLACGARPVDPLQLAAVYPREPEAVTQWRRLGKGH